MNCVSDEIESARLVLLSLLKSLELGNVAKVQSDCLNKLRPFVDDKGMLRVVDRLVNADVSYKQ